MIITREDLKRYIAEDLGKFIPIGLYPFFIFKQWVKGNENYPIIKLVYSLRHYEYYYNQPSLSIYGKLLRQFWRFCYRHNELAYNLFIGVNIAKEGLHLMHPGFRRFHTVARIGKNCTILPMVLIGKKVPNSKCFAVIGDNCYISTGVTILAPVKIGNNVTIGAGAVVTKDVPDNAIVAGVPAKIIGTNYD